MYDDMNMNVLMMIGKGNHLIGGGASVGIPWIDPETAKWVTRTNAGNFNTNDITVSAIPMLYKVSRLWL